MKEKSKRIDSKSAAKKSALEKIRSKNKHAQSPALTIKKIIEGDRLELSNAITIIESLNPEHRTEALKLIELATPYSGKSKRIGITGVPGVGKSTFIEEWGKILLSEDLTIAILTIDPSSQVSKGSILGDKTRMEDLSKESSVFIRPSPSSDSLGGVARKTREAIILCEAAGFDVILIETVGVGQSETAVHSMVDFFLLLMLAGAGDDLQGIKKGIMEMADTVVITKADGQNINKVNLAAKQYKQALHLFPPNPNQWVTPVVTCSSIDKSGLTDIWDTTKEFFKHCSENGSLEKNRENQLLQWMNDGISDSLNWQFSQIKGMDKYMSKLRDEVVQGKKWPYAAAQEAFDFYLKKLKES